MQPELYQCFAKETGLLESHFGGLGQSSSYVLGEEQHGLQWHIYVASVDPQLLPLRPPTYTLEVCMTELCPAKVPLLQLTAMASKKYPLLSTMNDAPACHVRHNESMGPDHDSTLILHSRHPSLWAGELS